MEGREFGFQFVQVGNPQVSIELGDGLEELDLARYGAAIERHEWFPRRTNVSFWQRIGEQRAARSHLRARGGGDDGLGHRRLGRGGRGSAARHGRAR